MSDPTGGIFGNGLDRLWSPQVRRRKRVLHDVRKMATLYNLYKRIVFCFDFGNPDGNLYPCFPGNLSVSLCSLSLSTLGHGRLESVLCRRIPSLADRSLNSKKNAVFVQLCNNCAGRGYSCHWTHFVGMKNRPACIPLQLCQKREKRRTEKRERTAHVQSVRKPFQLPVWWEREMKIIPEAGSGIPGSRTDHRHTLPG